MKKRVLCGFALFTVSAFAVHAQVKVYDGTLSLPYCQEGTPNPNASFD